MAGKDRGTDTGDYSATKAAENREHVESKAQTNNSSLKPGGLRGAPMDVGMSSLDPDTTGNPLATGENAPHDDVSPRHNTTPEAGKK
jgi:hypothetical protein